MRKLDLSTVEPAWRVLAAAVALAGFCYVPDAVAQTAPPAPAPATSQPAPAPAAKPAPAAPAAAATTAAKPKPDKKTLAAAQVAFQAGSKAFEAGDYATAQTEFQKAQGLVPAPQSQYWIAVSADKADAAMAQRSATIASYEAFLALPDADKAGADKVEAAKTRVAELRAGLDGSVALVTNPPGAAISVDGQLQQVTTPATLALKPGAHQISLDLAGYEPRQLSVTVAAEQKQDQSVELVAIKAAPPPPPVAPPPPPPAPEPEPERSLVPAYVTLGVAGAGAVVGTIFGIKALGAKSDFDEQPTTENADEVERNALIADMAFGVAVTLGVTGVVLLTSDEPDAEEARVKATRSARSRLQFAPYASQDGGGARARLTF